MARPLLVNGVRPWGAPGGGGGHRAGCRHGRAGVAASSVDLRVVAVSAEGSPPPGGMIGDRDRHHIRACELVSVMTTGAVEGTATSAPPRLSGAAAAHGEHRIACALHRLPVAPAQPPPDPLAGSTPAALHSGRGASPLPGGRVWRTRRRPAAARWRAMVAAAPSRCRARGGRGPAAPAVAGHHNHRHDRRARRGSGTAQARPSCGRRPAAIAPRPRRDNRRGRPPPLHPPPSRVTTATATTWAARQTA